MERLPVLKILRKGLYCALQDVGRFGYRHVGIPCSGAMDRHSFIYSNYQLGNNLNAAQLEIYGQGAVFLVLLDCILYLAGAEVVFTVDGLIKQTSDPIAVFSGQELCIKRVVLGTRLYIAVKGGFYNTPVMESISTLEGTHLRPLEKDHIIFKENDNICKKSSSVGIRKLKIDKSGKIPVLPGPEFHLLDKYSILDLTSKRFGISESSDRMGYRLLGNPLKNIQVKDILTSAVMPGTVQLTPDGQLIILMRECQTTGGYPRILQLEEWGISQLAQRSPGDDVVFNITK